MWNLVANLNRHSWLFAIWTGSGLCYVLLHSRNNQFERNIHCLFIKSFAAAMQFINCLFCYLFQFKISFLFTEPWLKVWVRYCFYVEIIKELWLQLWVLLAMPLKDLKTVQRMWLVELGWPEYVVIMVECFSVYTVLCVLICWYVVLSYRPLHKHSKVFQLNQLLICTKF